MLYNKDWDKPKETKKLEMWTLPHLIAWLETKPAGRFYEYCNRYDCLMSQYVTDHLGGKAITSSTDVDHFRYGYLLSKRYRLPPLFDRIARNDGSCTYGCALQWARGFENVA